MKHHLVFALLLAVVGARAAVRTDQARACCLTRSLVVQSVCPASLFSPPPSVSSLLHRVYEQEMPTAMRHTRQHGQWQRWAHSRRCKCARVCRGATCWRNVRASALCAHLSLVARTKQEAREAQTFTNTLTPPPPPPPSQTTTGPGAAQPRRPRRRRRRAGRAAAGAAELPAAPARGDRVGRRDERVPDRGRLGRRRQGPEHLGHLCEQGRRLQRSAFPPQCVDCERQTLLACLSLFPSCPPSSIRLHPTRKLQPHKNNTTHHNAANRPTRAARRRATRPATSPTTTTAAGARTSP